MAKIELKKYTEWLERRNLSPRTIRNYNQGLKKFIGREFDTESIVAFLKEILTKYEPKSLKMIRHSLKSYSKFEKIEIEWEIIDKIIPSVQRKFFPTIDESELERLKNTLNSSLKEFNQRNILLFDILFYTGLRISEIISVKHCDYRDGNLKVWGKGNKVRYIPIHDFLARNFNGSSNYLFVTRKNKQLSDVYIRMMICRKTKQAGINKIISPHTFRRSFATLLNNRGVKISTIQKLLGHASVDTTLTYIHNSYEEIYQELSVKLWKPSNLDPLPPSKLL